MSSREIIYAAAGATAPTYIEDVFSTYLYTGNGGAQTINNGIDLSGKGGMLWIKSRTSADASLGHVLADTTRGRGSYLRSQTTDAVVTSAPGYDISSFNNNGFSLNDPNGPNNFFLTNASNNFCSWTFREQPKFFDVVTYVGDATNNRAIPHNLGSTPGMLVIKRTDDTGPWWVWHRSLGSEEYVQLNSTTAAVSGFTDIWGPMTSTTFGVDNNASACNINTATYVAYLFAHDAGGFGTAGTDNVISCGSFTTDGSGNATVSLGYEPQYVMVKASSTTGNWLVEDVMRGLSQTREQQLFANTSDAENGNGPPNDITINATGFTTANSNVIGNSITYIYMAIRRPMKPPTSGTEVFSPVARTGNGSTASITGINFAPDVLLCSSRAGYWEASFNDRLRGFNRTLYTQLTSAESTNATSVTAMGNTSISLGAFGSVNASGQTYINWILRRASGFFDEVCYIGNDTAGRTVTHNLNSVPELMIIKDRTVGRNWIVYSSSTGNTKYLVLNQIAAPTTSSTIWNDTSPTSTVFTLGSGSNVNSSAENYVAYLFTTLAGVSKVGSYTGTGTTQTINCGFTGGARFVLIKRTDDSADWYVYDTARGMVSGTDPFLLLSTLEAETNQNDVFTTTTGFQLVSSFNGTNRNAASYIFLAIA